MASKKDSEPPQADSIKTVEQDGGSSSKQNESNQNLSDDQSNAKKPSKLQNQHKSARRAMNIFTVGLLLLIVAGIYLYQKGHITHYFPIVKSNAHTKSPLNQSGKNASPPSNSLDSNAVDLDDIPSKDQLETLDQKLNALGARVDALAESVALQSQTNDALPEQATPSNEGVSPTIAKSLLLTVSIEQKLHLGVAYEQDLQALSSVLSSKDLATSFDTLRQFSRLGVPKLEYLVSLYRPLATQNEKQTEFEAAESILNKAKVFASQFMTIVGPNDQKNTKTSLSPAQKEIMVLRQGNLDPSIKLWEDKKASGETISPKAEFWLIHARAYRDAMAAINSIKQYVIEQIK